MERPDAAWPPVAKPRAPPEPPRASFRRMGAPRCARSPSAGGLAFACGLAPCLACARRAHRPGVALDARPPGTVRAAAGHAVPRARFARHGLAGAPRCARSPSASGIGSPTNRHRAPHSRDAANSLSDSPIVANRRLRASRHGGDRVAGSQIRMVADAPCESGLLRCPHHSPPLRP